MARAETLKIVHLDSFAAVYHRASGITHLITAPAPEMLATLGEAGMTRAALLQRLATDYALGDGDGDGGDGGDGGEAVLAERLEELVATGLVSAA